MGRFKRRLPLVAAALVAIAVLAGFAATRLIASHQAPSALTLSATGTSGSPSALAGKWTVGAGSQAGYRAKEKFINQPAETEAVARTSQVTGSVTVAVQGNTVTVSQAKLSVDLASLTSQDRYATYQVYQRDFFVRTIYLDTQSFPTATFVAGTFSFPLPKDGPATVDVAGKLTVHGITKAVTAHLQAVDDGTQAELAGSMTVDMRDFAIEPPDISFTKAEPQVTIEFDLKLVRS